MSERFPVFSLAEIDELINNTPYEPSSNTASSDLSENVIVTNLDKIFNQLTSNVLKEIGAARAELKSCLNGNRLVSASVLSVEKSREESSHNLEDLQKLLKEKDIMIESLQADFQKEREELSLNVKLSLKQAILETKLQMYEDVRAGRHSSWKVEEWRSSLEKI